MSKMRGRCLLLEATWHRVSGDRVWPWPRFSQQGLHLRCIPTPASRPQSLRAGRVLKLQIRQYGWVRLDNFSLTRLRTRALSSLVWSFSCGRALTEQQRRRLGRSTGTINCDTKKAGGRCHCSQSFLQWARLTWETSPIKGSLLGRTLLRVLEPDSTLHPLYPLAPVVARAKPVVVPLLQAALLLLVLALLGVPLGSLLLLQLLLAEERDMRRLETSWLVPL